MDQQLWRPARQRRHRQLDREDSVRGDPRLRPARAGKQRSLRPAQSIAARTADRPYFGLSRQIVAPWLTSASSLRAVEDGAAIHVAGPGLLRYARNDKALK